MQMQERVGVRDLAAFACAGLAGCWYVLPRFAAQLVPFQAKLGRNCGQRHDLQDAGRIGSTPAETQAPKPLRQPGLPSPYGRIEKKTAEIQGPMAKKVAGLYLPIWKEKWKEDDCRKNNAT
jgi:hypothetical protein